MEGKRIKNGRAGRWSILFGTITFLCGCAHPLADNSHAVEQAGSEIAVPEGWDGSEGEQPIGLWVDSFDSEELESVVREALTANLTLQAARARLEEAEAVARIEGAQRLPNLSANLTGRRQMTSSGTEPVTRERFNTFGANLAVSWELDLWGRLQANVNAADADFAAEEADFAAARLLIASRVIEAWFSAVESQLQLALAGEALRSFESNLSIVEERFRSGLNPALDLRLARANVASARSTFHQNERLADVASRQLEVLLGRYPSGRITVGENLPVLLEPVPAGLPSDLLNRRPDIVASRSRLLASSARLQASKLALLPSFSLTGSLGRSSNELEDLLEDSFDVWSLLGGLSAPLFQGGRLRANISRADARLMESVANYEQTLLTAFREVESALAAEGFLREQKRSLDAAAEESSRALELAEERYGRGLVDIITVLEAQRRAFSSRSAALFAQKALLSNRLSLHLALGGPLF